MPLPAPHEVRATFSRLATADPERAVAYLYDLGLSSGYIKAGAVARNIRWTAASPYGDIECTINLSKPEKDPRAIAADAMQPSSTMPDRASQHKLRRVPQCDLCWENEGFPGTPEHPAKPGLRVAAITLGGECWGLQYSPYAYFTEHCIALSKEHRPMKIDGSCLERLLDFVDAFPFYFIGSNADLPIVGGSILSHDHFQGGRHVFPLMKAPVDRSIHLEGLPEVQCGIVHWPASVLRLTSEDRTALSRAASRILSAWRAYSNESCNIIAASNAPHNTLNPLVRKQGSTYIMDLVLRNNRTDSHHPWGIFHPDESLHHIKRENIGLIEIMGLAILPPRLAEELPLVQHRLVEAARKDLPAAELTARLEGRPETAPHAVWATDVYVRRAAEFVDAVKPIATSTPAAGHAAPGSAARKTELHPVVQQEVASIFSSILGTTGVFKRNAAGTAGWNTFIDRIAKPE